MVICDCSAVQSAVCLAAAAVFLLGATRHFVLLSCKICAEIVVYRMLAVFLNGQKNFFLANQKQAIQTLLELVR